MVQPVKQLNLLPSMSQISSISFIFIVQTTFEYTTHKMHVNFIDFAYSFTLFILFPFLIPIPFHGSSIYCIRLDDVKIALDIIRSSM